MALVYTTKNAVMTALETALKTLSWVTTVDREHIGLEEYNYKDNKGVMLHDIREVRRTVLIDCIDVNYTAAIVVYAIDESQEALSSTLNAAIEEVKLCIQQNFFLGGIVSKVIIGSVDTDMGFQSPQAWATFVLEISYLSEV